MSIRFDNRSPDGQGGRGRRASSSLVLWAVVAIGAVLVWTVGAFALGVGGSGSNAERNISSDTPEESNREQTEPLQDMDEAPVAEEGVPVSNRPEDSGQGYAASEDGDRRGASAGIGDGTAVGGDSPPDGGVENGSGGHDPLGVSGQEVPLLPADKERARAAASQFVAAAYGYTGGPGEEDVRKYISGVSDHALTPEFYSSPGAEEVKRYEKLVRSSGTESAALLDLFDIQEVIPERRGDGEYTQQRVVGYAYFRTADEYNRYGEIEGNEKSYRQRLTLERYRAVFKVYAADEIEEVRE